MSQLEMDKAIKKTFNNGQSSSGNINNKNKQTFKSFQN